MRQQHEITTSACCSAATAICRTRLGAFLPRSTGADIKAGAMRVKE